MSNELETVLREANSDEVRFAIAMLYSRSRRAAGQMIGLNDKYVYNPEFCERTDAILALLKRDIAASAMKLVQHNVLKAAAVMSELMNDPDPSIRLRAAKDVQDRAFGKATVRQEIDHRKLVIEYKSPALNPDVWDEDEDIEDAIIIDG